MILCVHFEMTFIFWRIIYEPIIKLKFIYVSLKSEAYSLINILFCFKTIFWNKHHNQSMFDQWIILFKYYHLSQYCWEKFVFWKNNSMQSILAPFILDFIFLMKMKHFWFYFHIYPDEAMNNNSDFIWWKQNKYNW
jgi:hypothetical protein